MVSTRLSFLFNRADKVLLLAVPYLTAVSILYYAGYWGVLRVDVYNYFELSDLIKGAAYPMQFALATAVIGAFFDFALTYFSFSLMQKTRSMSFILFLMLLISAVTIIGICLAFPVMAGMVLYGREPSGFLAANLPLLNVPVYVSGLIFSLGAWSTARLTGGLAEKGMIELEIGQEGEKESRTPSVRLKANPQFTGHLQLFALVFALLTTPFFSLASGYFRAQHILSGQDFDYVEPRLFSQDTLLTSYPYLKYLGRVGESHFLLTPDNSRRLILSKDHWPILSLLSSATHPPVIPQASIQHRP